MYKTVSERMDISLRRKDAEATGKPLYQSYGEVPAGLLSATACKKAKCPIVDGEAPAAYVLSRQWLGYLPLYARQKGGA